MPSCSGIPSLIEPLSLDEAYLDVTENKTGLPTATRVAQAVRRAIREELGLTASAGVAPNKFLTRIASDWRKPDGLFVIQPSEVETFLDPLPVGRIPGVGRVTEERLRQLGVAAVGELRGRTAEELESRFVQAALPPEIQLHLGLGCSDQNFLHAVPINLSLEHDP